MNMTNNPKPWAEGHPSLYQGHDITHRPDWANIIAVSYTHLTLPTN